VDPGHTFTQKGRASLAEIGAEQLIFFDQSSSYFEQTHALLRNAGIRELRTMEVDNIEAAKRMVEHRLGVAFLPRTAVVRSVASGNLSLISVEEEPEMSRSIVALRRRDTPASGPVAAFLEVAETLGEKRSETELSPVLATEFENLQLIDLFT
jgi:DNA-binding transcriptional LysR family regulator